MESSVERFPCLNKDIRPSNITFKSLFADFSADIIPIHIEASDQRQHSRLPRHAMGLAIFSG